MTATPLRNGHGFGCALAWPDHDDDAACTCKAPTTILVTIGNSDDKLTQAEWAAFQARTDRLIRIAATEVHGRFHSLPDAPWQTAAWSFSIPPLATVGSGFAALAGVPDDRPADAWLRDALAAVAGEYRQDSIAWTAGPTWFLGQRDRA